MAFATIQMYRKQFAGYDAYGVHNIYAVMFGEATVWSRIISIGGGIYFMSIM